MTRIYETTQMGKEEKEEKNKNDNISSRINIPIDSILKQNVECKNEFQPVTSRTTVSTYAPDSPSTYRKHETFLAPNIYQRSNETNFKNCVNVEDFIPIASSSSSSSSNAENAYHNTNDNTFKYEGVCVQPKRGREMMISNTKLNEQNKKNMRTCCGIKCAKSIAEEQFIKQTLYERYKHIPTYTFSPLKIGDDVKIQQQIIVQNNFKNQMSDIIGNPVSSHQNKVQISPTTCSEYDKVTHMPRLFNYVNAKSIQNKVNNYHAAYGGDSYNDKLIDSQFRAEQTDGESLVAPCVYEHCEGIGRIQVCYVNSNHSNGKNISFPIVTLPKMTPYDIYKYKEIKKIINNRYRGNYFETEKKNNQKHTNFFTKLFAQIFSCFCTKSF